MAAMTQPTQPKASETPADEPLMLPVPIVAREPLTMSMAPARSWSALTIPVPVYPEVARVAAKSITRADLKISNLGEVDVICGPEQAATSPDSGYTLGAGKDLTLTTAAEVWATAPTAGGRVGIIAQYRDGA